MYTSHLWSGAGHDPYCVYCLVHSSDVQSMAEDCPKLVPAPETKLPKEGR